MQKMDLGETEERTEVATKRAFKSYGTKQKLEGKNRRDFWYKVTEIQAQVKTN